MEPLAADAFEMAQEVDDADEAALFLAFGDLLAGYLQQTAMRRFLTLILFLAFAALSASAQMVQDASYRVVGHIKSDGTIQDQTYKVIGHIKSNGTIQDASYRTVGFLDRNGTVQDASYRVVGHIKPDGVIQDSSYRILGYVKTDGTVQDDSYRVIGHVKGVPMEWAALYFFFR